MSRVLLILIAGSVRLSISVLHLVLVVPVTILQRSTFDLLHDLEGLDEAFRSAHQQLAEMLLPHRLVERGLWL